MLSDACNLLLLKYNIDLLAFVGRSDEHAFSSLSRVYRTTQGSLKTTPKDSIYRPNFLSRSDLYFGMRISYMYYILFICIIASL